MMVTDNIVTLLAKHLKENSELEVVKYERSPHYVGDYVAVNCKPIYLGNRAVNSASLNVNIHARKLKSGGADVKKLGRMFDVVSSLIHTDDGTEDGSVTSLGGVDFSIVAVSQPKEDKDDTYYVNVQVNGNFTLLNVTYMREGILGLSKLGFFILSN